MTTETFLKINGSRIDAFRTWFTNPTPEQKAKEDQRLASMAERDIQMFEERIAAFNKVSGPRVGDYLQLWDGSYTRFTHAWDDGIQTGGGGGSYYIGNGYLSYSGGLDPSVRYSLIQPTEETKTGTVWAFHNDHRKAHNGVYYQLEFRVFKLKPFEELTEGESEDLPYQLRKHSGSLTRV